MQMLDLLSPPLPNLPTCKVPVMLALGEGVVMEVRVVLSVVPRPRREDRLLSLWRQMIIISNQIAVLSPGWRVSSVLPLNTNGPDWRLSSRCASLIPTQPGNEATSVPPLNTNSPGRRLSIVSTSCPLTYTVPAVS